MVEKSLLVEKFIDQVFWEWIAEVYSGLSQTSNMKSYATIVNCTQLLQSASCWMFASPMKDIEQMLSLNDLFATENTTVKII